MKVKRQELVNVLTAIKPGLAKKAIVDQATHFIITGDRVLTYNDRICISYPYKTDFSCSISAEEFYKILNRIPDEDVTIDLDEGKLMVHGLKVRASLATETGDDILSLVNALAFDQIGKLNPLPKDFVEAVKLCVFSASKDISSPALACLFIKGKTIAATDDLRISEYKMSTSMKCSFLLPASSAEELIKFDPDQFYIAEEKTWIYFVTKEGAIFCSRLVDDTFPDYARFLDGFGNDSITLPENMNELVETASILTNDENDAQEVEVQIDKGKLRCKGQNKLGWIESETRIQTKLSVSFIINSAFFLGILGHTHIMFLDEGRALFTGGEFRHVVALKGI
jgi:DNA polymerase III sliding clamp (beta) subunit (PCNA family)